MQCDELRGKLQTTERYCSTLETSHHEMKLRCEYLQNKLNAVSVELDSDEPRRIPEKYMELYESHYRELESDRHLDRVMRSLSQQQSRYVK